MVVNGAAIGLLALGGVNALLRLDVLVLDAAAVLGGLAAILGAIPLVILLFVAWGELESAETHARAIRHETRAWVRPEPGSSFLAHAARTKGRAHWGADSDIASGHRT